MMKAIWNNEILAESDDTIVVENNHLLFALSELNFLKVGDYIRKQKLIH